ncbi:MAG: hypothetical protein ACP6IU_04370 [Candidatus Asgardarchaeia archaeon]
MYSLDILGGWVLAKLSPKEVATQIFNDVDNLIKQLNDLLSNGKFKHDEEKLFYNGLFKSLRGFKTLRDQYNKSEEKEGEYLALDFLGDVLIANYTASVRHKELIEVLKAARSDLKKFMAILDNDPDITSFNSYYLRNWVSLLMNIKKLMPNRDAMKSAMESEESEPEKVMESDIKSK